MITNGEVSGAALESRARRAARRVGIVARKSRWRLGSVDNRGGFMLLEPIANRPIAGIRWDLSATVVIEWCRAANA